MLIDPSLIDQVTINSLLAVVAILVVSLLASRLLLPSSSTRTDHATFVWFAFDALIHFIFEGSFVYHSTFGRTVNTGKDMFALLWQEYAKADERWGTADVTIVSIEIMTVFVDGLICLHVLRKLISNDPSRHFWIVVVSLIELVGGWMTFAPEWLSGSQYLNTHVWLWHYVYLWFFNGLWVVIPIALIGHSYRQIICGLTLANDSQQQKKSQ
ncbi:Emopamil-binding protein [Hesseltinella vesiculosa]|uniref:Emopamil-binding protein n=1 Tax=Hesseltinella vesiculosa TaxID=101127 RepID=A0A1X2GJ79_9FUNG|nr:Emopamil-binding protein [Hesseltinella vesiculosa]